MGQADTFNSPPGFCISRPVSKRGRIEIIPNRPEKGTEVSHETVREIQWSKHR